MNYFYDHETDAVSIVFADFLDYAATEEVVPGVVMYVDGGKRPLAIDLRPASQFLDTNGLVPMYERPITSGEVSQRFSATVRGQSVLRMIGRRTGFAAVAAS